MNRRRRRRAKSERDREGRRKRSDVAHHLHSSKIKITPFVAPAPSSSSQRQQIGPPPPPPPLSVPTALPLWYVLSSLLSSLTEIIHYRWAAKALIDGGGGVDGEMDVVLVGCATYADDYSRDGNAITLATPMMMMLAMMIVVHDDV